MKLTNNEINRMAAELLGEAVEFYWWCDSCQAEVPPERVTYTEHHDVPNCGAGLGINGPRDFIHDANAVRELVRWFVENAARYSLAAAAIFLDEQDTDDYCPSPLNALVAPPRTITLAVLYATGKLTEQQAKEAMSDEA